jgi:hypothetical protein
VTVGNWKRKFPWFAEEMDAVTCKIFDTVESNVFEAALGPALNPVAMSARRFLLCYHPEGRRRRYCRKEELEGTVQIRSFVDLMTAADACDQD